MPKYRSYREALSVPMQIQVYRQVEISESALRLQRELKNHVNYLVPLLLAALTLRLQINTAKLCSRVDETQKCLQNIFFLGD